MRPSRVNPHRSATRCEATLSGPHVSSSRTTSTETNAQRASRRPARVAAPRPRAGVGYWLVPAARGRGVATRAVRLLARWAFDSLGVVRLELTCGPDNVASQRVAERCGFTREGLMRAHLPFKGGRRDTVL